MVDKSITIKIKPSVWERIHCEQECGESNSDTIARVFDSYMKAQENELTKLEESVWREDLGDSS
jgi:hypothetical protein